MFLSVLSGGLDGWANSTVDSEQNFGLFLSFISFCVFIGSIVVLYSAMKTMWQSAKSEILKKNVKKYIVMNILWVIFGVMFMFAIEADNSGLGIFAGILFLISLIYFIILRYRVYKEVAYITNQPLFMSAFWLGMTIILLPIAVIIYIIAWIKVCEIRESMSAGEYESESEKAGNANSALIIIALVLVAIIGITIAVVLSVAVPKYKVGKMNARVATARSDLASAQAAIVRKVFADNIDTTKPKAPNPNPLNADYMEWGEWIIEVAKLDSMKWKASGNGIYAIDNSKRKACYDRSRLPLLWIDTNNGNMVFNPNKLSDSYNDGFCENLRDSYKSSGGPGNKIIPLASTGTVEF